MQVRIIDDTLREGEQTPGVRYTTDSRVSIYKSLANIGMKHVNIGSPSISHNVEGIKKILDLGYTDIEHIGHLGCSKNEVDKAADLGLDSVKLYIAPTKGHLLAKFGKRFKNLDEARAFCLDKVEESVIYAKKRGLSRISYTAEDMTSTLLSEDDRVFSYKVIKAALDNGATRVSLPDTRGRATPSEIENMIKDFKKNFSSYNIDIETHFHNDLGLAVANSLSAINSGANFIHTTVNGMGERVGITPLEQLDAALYYGLGIDTGIKHDKLYELSKIVEMESGFHAARNAPVIGENAFTHTAGRHQQAVVKDAMTYQTIEPDVYGRNTTLSLGALTGKEGVRGFIKICGVDVEGLDDSRIADIADNIRKYHVQTGVSDVSVAREIIEKSLGVSLKIPKHYMDQHFLESYMTIKTDAGQDETLIKAKIMDVLKRMPSVVRIDEIFGSIDYMVLLRYPSKDMEKVKKEAEKRLHDSLGNAIKNREFLDIGDRYRL